MAACPVCGAETGTEAAACPGCRLDRQLFGPVREAMALGRDADPAFARTVAELIGSVDLLTPATPLAEPEPAASPEESALLLGGARLPVRDRPGADTIPGVLAMPSLPTVPKGDALRSRAYEYEVLAPDAGVDLGDLPGRADAAEAADDDSALEEAVREMFVHLASALVERYDREAARRNELAPRTPVPDADRALASVRAAVDGGDLTGAYRALAQARQELGRAEEAWATRRILLTECELLASTVRELGGDPSPALGPLEEGRRVLAGPEPERAEAVLAQTAFALWVVLEPRFTDRLRQYRDRLVELGSAGAELGPALERLRTVGAQLKRRNFVGMIVAYRQLREMIGPSSGAEPEPVRLAVRGEPPA